MNVYHRSHRFDARIKPAKEHMMDNGGDVLTPVKSISAWATLFGIYPRTASNWYTRVGLNSDGTRKFGVQKGRSILLTLEEWNRIQAEGKGVPGIKKGYKYKEGVRGSSKVDS